MSLITTSFLFLIEGLQLESLQKDSAHQEAQHDKNQSYDLLVDSVGREGIRYVDVFVLDGAPIVGYGVGRSPVEIQVPLASTELQ